MATPTYFDPSIILPAYITSPPTAQFTPGPGCVDSDDNWVVFTSCYAYPSSYDWLTCSLTNFGPVNYPASPCAPPWEAQTVVGDITSYYSGCPSGYSGASTAIYSDDSRPRYDVGVYCCPTQYPFDAYGYLHDDGIESTTTGPNGEVVTVEYPLPGCTASFIKQLSDQVIPVQTSYNTGAWEKRQVNNVPWDYVHGTMYAAVQSYSYTVFYNTHTCYQNCYDWHDYYFSGSAQPSFTVPPDYTPATTAPVTPPPPTETPPEQTVVDTPPPPVETSTLTTTPTPTSTEAPSTSEEPLTTEGPPFTESSSSMDTSSEMTQQTIAQQGTSTPASDKTTAASSSGAQSTTASPSATPTGAGIVVTPVETILLGSIIAFLLMQ
ncbi:hypothetical protein GGR57DRAFT_467990 [Xylariaceae sp. FL1272]|nr:hypothetical protein GGR57DRAFT_467990 [Xylariaceae sp. FL1272]